MTIQVNSTTVIDDTRNLTASTTTLTGTVNAGNLVGDGSGLTSLPSGGGATTNTSVISLDAATYIDPVVDANWAQITHGFCSAAAIKTDGSLWTWGANAYGELGQNDQKNRNRPTKVGTSSWTQVAATSMFIVAMKADGTIWGAGKGAKGDNTNTNYSTFTQIGSASNWTYLQSDYHGSFGAINSSGQLWCMGLNQYGKLGVGIGAGWVSSLMQVSGTWKQGYRTVRWTRYHMMAVQSDGTGWAAGYNGQGQLGLSPGAGNVPNAIGGPGGYTHVAPDGQFGAYYVTSSGSIWALGALSPQWWGKPAGTISSPTQISTSSLPTNIKWVLDGAAVIRSDGTLWFHDNGTYMELGSGADKTKFNNNNFSKSSWIQLGTRTWGSATQPLTNPMIGGGYSFVPAGGAGRFCPYYLIDSTGTLRINGAAGSGYPYYYNANNTDWDLSGLGALTGDYNGPFASYKAQTVSYNNFSKAVTGRTNFDCTYNSFVLNHDDDIWSITFSNVPTVCEIEIIRKRNGYRSSDKTWAPTYDAMYGAGVGNELMIMWPNNIMWDKGVSPTKGLRAGDDTEVITLTTSNGGTTWYGRVDCDYNIGSSGSGGSYANAGVEVQGGANMLSADGKPLGYLWSSGSGGMPANPPQWGFPDLPAQKSSPVLLSNDLWKKVMTDGGNIIAIRADGTIWASGGNGNGMLGLGNTLTYSTFVQIYSFRNDWADIQMNVNSGVMAVTTGGELWVSGYQYRGTFGTGSTIQYSTPVQVSLPSGLKGKVKTVSFGQWQTWIVASDGTLWRTGAAQDSSIGYSSGGVVDLSTFTQLESSTNWVGFSDTTQLRNIVIKQSNNSWYGVASTDGVPGFADGLDWSAPVQLGSRGNSNGAGLLYNPKWYGSGFRGANVITADGDLWGAGYANIFRQSDSAAGFAAVGSSFVLMESNTKFRKIYQGNQLTFWGIKDDGTLWGWGYNNSYWNQAVYPSSVLVYSSPVQIGTGGDWISLSTYSYGWVGLRNTPF
jgi:alpha-tubulin suppressor-like RCC1 family protein